MCLGSARKRPQLLSLPVRPEYVAVGNCCLQVLWTQHKLRDYGLNFSHIPIMIDNPSTISTTNNPVKHSKTKYIEIRHHFIRDCAEKQLIMLVKVSTENNLTDMYTKAFDISQFDMLVQLNEM